ncbi:MAG: alkaline phosphatase D family protein [Pirellulaceae bacterium]|nr:alkaline phosphatase D family protein [Pirellulaceae bacterium]
MKSNGQSILLLIATCIAAPCIADEELPHITTGPILGRLSANGIGVWARMSRESSFQVRYGLSQDAMDQITDPVPTRLNHDNTGWVHITNLKARTEYFYELVIPGSTVRTGRGGSFRTLPNGRDYVDKDLNPKGLFNFSFEFACGNNQNLGHSIGPALPTFRTMLDRIADDIDFAILNGDWLYESQREFKPSQWLAQVDCPAVESPKVVRVAPTIVGVWENYKHYFRQADNLSRWHREVPSFFLSDDHEILNDIWGAGTPGLRDRRAVFRDIGIRAWYDYLGWSNPTTFKQPVHFGRAKLTSGSDVLVDTEADFTKLDLAQHNNLHVHWGTRTAGVNDNALDGVGGDPNAGVYRIEKVVDKNRIKVFPSAKTDGTSSYSIGRRSYYNMRLANCDFFFTDTRGQREMHDTREPDKPGLSMLGKEQREWLLSGVQKSDADFIFVVSSVNFMVPHVGGGAVRAENKDDAWTVFFDERERLINAWDKLDKPVFVLTGDLHNSFVIKITDNVWEMASGPHNSNNHWASDEGDRRANGKFKYGPREVDIYWSSYFRTDIPRDQLKSPGYCVVQINNVFNNPQNVGGERWVAFPRPHVIFQYFDGYTGKLRYAQSIHAHTNE